MPTSVANYRLTGSKESYNRARLAADNLLGRFNLAGNFIRAWNDNNSGQKAGWAIIDCMMNLPLLYWAYEESKDPRYLHVALAHANTAMKYFVREDGSVNHIVEFDAMTGEYIQSFGGQGYEVGSSWTRGQAWAIYGYALSYMHTGKKAYLETAKKVAHYFIANLGDDYVPVVDFRAPKEPVLYDSSAGVITACGLIEIAKAVGENESDLYLNAALKILRATTEKCADFTEENQQLINLGTSAYHQEDSHHMTLIYGDYYYLEALIKLCGKDMLFW